MFGRNRRQVFIVSAVAIAVAAAGIYFSFNRIEDYFLSYLKRSIPASAAGFDIVMKDPYIKLLPPSVSFVSLTGSRNGKKYLEIGGCKVADIIKFVVSSDKDLSLKCTDGFVSGAIPAFFTSRDAGSRIKNIKDEKTEGSSSRTIGKISFNVSIDDLLLEKGELKEHFKAGFEFDGKNGIFRFRKTNSPLNTDSGEFIFSADSKKAGLRIENVSIDPLTHFFPFLKKFKPGGQASGIIDFRLKEEKLLLYPDVSFSDISSDNPMIDKVPFRLSFLRINGPVEYNMSRKELEIKDMKVTIGGVDGTLSGTISSYMQKLDLTMDNASIVRLATVVSNDLFSRFNTGGAIDIRVYYNREKDSPPEIQVVGNVDEPVQFSDRINYLKREFRYKKETNGQRDIVIGPSNSYFVSIHELPEHLLWAVITSEDAGFYKHAGIDFAEISAAAKDNVKRKKMRGGSTITQQLTKNLFLGKEQTFVRKFREMLLAIELDATLSKNRILEIYLNIIEWAPDVFGIGEASLYYFGKSPMELSVLESAYLASIIPGPYLYHRQFLKNKISDRWVDSMHKIINRMYESDKITTQEYLDAIKGKIIFREIDREGSEEE